LRSPPVAAFLAALRSFSWPTVGGLKRPNATVKVSLSVGTSPVGVSAFAGAFGVGAAVVFASGFSGAGDLPTAPFG
jgi:hypothetical protein